MPIPIKICTVVEGGTLPVFLRNLANEIHHSAMVELRADSINGFEEEDIYTLKRNVSIPSIFTFRHVKEGGLFAGDTFEQRAILKRAFHSGFEYVDVSCGNKILKELIPKEKKKLILSYHSNDSTPSYTKLAAILEQMRSVKPAIIKIATKINSHADIFKLADILKMKKEREKLIVIGLGEKGKPTRILFPLIGSYLAFASMVGSKIAPGIMSHKQMESIYKLITYNS